MREYGGLGRIFGTLLLSLAFMALLGWVAYLLSDINHRHYRLVLKQGTLKVERGLFLPLGFGIYAPDNAALQEAYAPLKVPRQGMGGPIDGPIGIFDDRSDLDRALFGLLSEWSRKHLDTSDAPTLRVTTAMIKRLALLPGLSEDQRAELRTLRSHLAIRHGEQLMEEAVSCLKQAQESFRLALELGTDHPDHAQKKLEEVERRLALYLSEPLAVPPHPPVEESPHPSPTSPSL